MQRIRKKLTDSSARGLSLCSKRSGNFPLVVTEGDRFFFNPELQTDGVDVAWSGVVDVDNACIDFLLKNNSVGFVPAGRGLLRASWTFDIVRYERECVLICAMFSPRRLIDEKGPCNQSESSYVCGLLTLNTNG